MAKMLKYGMIIDGEEVAAIDGKRLDVINPADETLVGRKNIYD